VSRFFRFLAALFVLVAFQLAVGAAQAEKRIALVIGNAGYQAGINPASFDGVLSDFVWRRRHIVFDQWKRRWRFKRGIARYPGVNAAPGTVAPARCLLLTQSGHGAAARSGVTNGTTLD
jgi:hypothetical protein